MANKYVHLALGSDATGDGTAANPYGTLNHALAVAGGGDEIRVGGADSPTWAMVRFIDPVAGSDITGGGKRPASAYRTIEYAWADLYMEELDESLIILVKGDQGSIGYGGSLTLESGGMRSSSSVNTMKVLRGYHGQDYFGNGKATIEFTGGGSDAGLRLSMCCQVLFRNIDFVDQSESATTRNLVEGYNGIPSFCVNFVNCGFLDFQNYGVACDLTNQQLYYTKFLYCRFRGKSKTSTGAVRPTTSGTLAIGCLFERCRTPFDAGNCTGYSLSRCLINNCTLGLDLDQRADKVYDHMIFANCDTAIGADSGYYDSHAIVENSIVYNCGALMNLTKGTLLMRNCCVYPRGTTSLLKSTGTDTVDASFLSDGCKIADPKFFNPSTQLWPACDFRLHGDSPCWNMAGSNPFITNNFSNAGLQNPSAFASRSRSNFYANVTQTIIR